MGVVFGNGVAGNDLDDNDELDTVQCCSTKSVDDDAVVVGVVPRNRGGNYNGSSAPLHRGIHGVLHQLIVDAPQIYDTSQNTGTGP